MAAPREHLKKSPALKSSAKGKRAGGRPSAAPVSAGKPEIALPPVTERPAFLIVGIKSEGGGESLACRAGLCRQYCGDGAGTVAGAGRSAPGDLGKPLILSDVSGDATRGRTTVALSSVWRSVEHPGSTGAARRHSSEAHLVSGLRRGQSVSTCRQEGLDVEWSATRAGIHSAGQNPPGIRRDEGRSGIWERTAVTWIQRGGCLAASNDSGA